MPPKTANAPTKQAQPIPTANTPGPSALEKQTRPVPTSKAPPPSPNALKSKTKPISEAEPPSPSRAVQHGEQGPGTGPLNLNPARGTQSRSSAGNQDALPQPKGYGPFPGFNETWAECFAFTKQKILAWLHELSQRPEMTTDRVQKGMEIVLFKLTAFINRTSRVSGAEVIMTKPLVGATPGDAAAVALDPIWLPLGASILPHFSVFDLLGWCMARAAVDIAKNPKAPETAPQTTTDENYYLPLLALFSQWVRVLADFETERPSMLSITWFLDTALKGSAQFQPMVIGSTIPDFFRTQVQQNRLARMKAVKVIGAPKDVRPLDLTTYPTDPQNREKKATGQSYGHCAETNQFLLYAYLNPNLRSAIRGISIEPKVNLSVYNALAASKNLRDPCPNCQRVILQVLGDKSSSGNLVLQKFGVTEIQKRIANAFDRPLNPGVRI